MSTNLLTFQESQPAFTLHVMERFFGKVIVMAKHEDEAVVRAMFGIKRLATITYNCFQSPATDNQ